VGFGDMVPLLMPRHSDSISDPNWLCFAQFDDYVQARIDAEKVRLAGTRLPETNPLAAAAAAVGGQKLMRSITLQELLKRPHIHYKCVRHGVLLMAEHSWQLPAFHWQLRCLGYCMAVHCGCPKLGQSSRSHRSSFMCAV
jgi:hypothetical protein